VTNVVDGVLKAVKAPGASGNVINVATGSSVSLNRLFTTMRDMIGTRIEAKYGPTRSGDVRDSIADITKARTLLGYEPTVSLEEGLKKTIDWYRRPN
jgi:nucleoside-diphosphate-sugar epimerase